MSSPKVILFDAAGTLFHLPCGVGWHYADVAGRFGVNLEAAALDRAFRAAWKTAVPAPEVAGPRPDDDRDWWRALVFSVLDAVDAPAALDRGAYFGALWDEFARPGVWEPFPETVEVIAHLANRYRLGVLSNFDSRLHAILSHLRLAGFFEHVIVSSEIGAEKPSTRMFAEAADRFDVAPEWVLHVGDEPEADWAGARRAGMQAFELKRPEKSLRELVDLLR